jgi:ribosome-associated toxin RatA of RatAB toxin-antitoxin module
MAYLRFVRALVLGAAALFGASGCAGSDGGSLPPPPVTPAPPASVVPKAAPTTEPAATAEPPVLDGGSAPNPPADGPVAESLPVAGSDLVHGRTAVVVKAPIQRVREAVFDFAHYAEFMPHYTSCKVLGRTPSGARDVYMEVEALHGVVKMWAEIEVPKPVVGPDGAETIETRFIKGNVKLFLATWRLRKVDDASTELSLEVFLDPGLSLPPGLVNRENLTGSTRGVVAMRGHAEQPKK